MNTLRITNLFNLGKTHFLFGITQQLCLDHNEVIDNEFEKDHYYVTDSDTSLTTPKDIFDKEEVDDDEDRSSSQETKTKIISRLPARGSSIILFANEEDDILIFHKGEKLNDLVRTIRNCDAT